MHRLSGICLLLLLLTVLAACGGTSHPVKGYVSRPVSPVAVGGFDAYPPMDINPKRTYSAILTTDVGRATFSLFREEAPLAVNSFVFLAKQGFYNEVAIHRLVPGVLAETGDPTGTGEGGPGYTFDVEPPHRPYARGDLVMTNSGTPATNGSRFYIILGDVSASGDLAADYTLLGEIKKNHKVSQRTLENLESVELGPDANGEITVPLEGISILSITVAEGCLPGQGRYTGCPSGGAH